MQDGLFYDCDKGFNTDSITVISPVCVLLCIWRWIRCEKCFLHWYTFLKFPYTVCSFITMKSTVVSKDLTTLTTFIGVLSTLWSFVHLKMTVFCKGLTKMITIIGFLSRMCFLCNWRWLQLATALSHWLHSWCFYSVYIFFNAIEDFCVLQRPYNTDNIHRVFFSPECFLSSNWKIFWYAKTLPHWLHS